MMDRHTKTDLRLAPLAPRDGVPQPAPTGDEEHALLFGEADGSLNIDPTPLPTEPGEETR